MNRDLTAHEIKYADREILADRLDALQKERAQHHDRYNQLRDAYDRAAKRAAIHGETLLLILDLVDSDLDDDAMRDAIRNKILAGHDRVAQLIRSDTRPNPSGGAS